jgi:predicted DNA-binding protein (MmcQ/YjbR family)
MDIEELREYCLGKRWAEETFPFDNETLVFKVGGKAFLLTGINSRPVQFNVKCDPVLAIELREEYSSVLPGYHMNKKHWNTIICDGSMSRKQLEQWINHSYELVVKSLSKKQKEQL